MLPQGFGDPIAGFAYTDNKAGRDTPPLDRKSCAVVVWVSLHVWYVGVCLWVACWIVRHLMKLFEDESLFL